MYNRKVDTVTKRILSNLLKSAFALFLGSTPMQTNASGVSPYLPVKLSPILENEIERLFTLSGTPNLTKPYSLSTTLAAMEKIKLEYPLLYSRLNKYFQRYKNTHSLTHLSARLASSNENHPKANSRGLTTDTHTNVAFQAQWNAKSWLGVFVGGNVTYYQDSLLEHNMQPSGSMISLGSDWAQLDIGYKDIWLSPFQGTAQLLSTHAETLPSISLSNNLTLETFGIKWNYNAFIAQTSRQLVQFQPGEFSDKDKPMLSGLHVNFQPTEWWTIGASRMFQFGGGERPVSASTLLRALIDPRGADNDATVAQESGNQIASISSKINFDGALPFSVSIELAGEDTSNNKREQLGNTALTAGLYYPYFLSNRISLNYEYSSWQSGWYTNNVYSQGYVNNEFVMGHWAMQPQRSALTATPGNSHYLESHWQRINDHVLSLKLKTSENTSTSAVEYINAWELELQYSMPLRSNIFSAGIYIGRDSFGEDFSQLNLSWEF